MVSGRNEVNVKVLAEKRYKETCSAVSQVRRKKRRSLIYAVVNSIVAFVCVVSVVICLVACVYVGVYAKATESGYRKSDLLAELRALRTENEELRLDLERRRRPAEIEAFATQNGMQQVSPVAYLGRPTGEPQIAQNVGDGEY